MSSVVQTLCTRVDSTTMTPPGDLDRHPARPSDLELAFADFRQGRHGVLPSSSSEEFSEGCPSLSSSNSISSDGLTEPENDTPPQSPTVSLVDVFAWTMPLDSVSQFHGLKDETDVITPRPKFTEPRSYFGRIAKGADMGYESEGETGGPVRGNPRVRRSDRSKAVQGPVACTSSPVQSQPHSPHLALQATTSALEATNGSKKRRCRPSCIDLPVSSGSAASARAARQYVGLGLGMAAPWVGQSATGSGSPGDPLLTSFRFPTASQLSPRSLEIKKHLDERKPALRPIDELEFLDSPSPIDALPPLDTSSGGSEGRKVTKVTDSMPSVGPPYSIGAFVGLGLRVDAGNDSEAGSVVVGTCGLGGSVGEDTFNPYFAVVGVLEAV